MNTYEYAWFNFCRRRRGITGADFKPTRPTAVGTAVFWVLKAPLYAVSMLIRR